MLVTNTPRGNSIFMPISGKCMLIISMKTCYKKLKGIAIFGDGDCYIWITPL